MKVTDKPTAAELAGWVLAMFPAAVLVALWWSDQAVQNFLAEVMLWL